MRSTVQWLIAEGCGQATGYGQYFLFPSVLCRGSQKMAKEDLENPKSPRVTAEH